MDKMHFDEQGRFVVENYNEQKPFASFLPGIAGLEGIPLWVYYVNRGQGIASFGVENKDCSILEFLPADKSYQAVSYNGFRTFIKLIENGKTELLEPFSQLWGQASAIEHMLIKPNELSFEYINDQKGLSVTVSYFTLPHENFAALARQVTIKNISNKPINMEVLDGLPGIIPVGMSNAAYKELGHTLRAWMHVYNLESNVPFYKVRSSTEDTAEVSEITAGHFYLSFTSDNEGSASRPIVDTDLVFGNNTSFAYPASFMSKSLKELLTMDQVVVNKKPGAFSGFAKTLSSEEEMKIMSLYGNVSNIDIIQNDLPRLTSLAFFTEKRLAAEKLVSDITMNVDTHTASTLFDGYTKQCYLDNLLRGGYPLLLENGKEKPFVYHVFSRKHGDLERDYNFFSLATEFYSQGNGNFRDANQNRRNDSIIHPGVGDFNVKMFMDLIQTDGYNPLVVKGCTFTVSPEGIEEVAKLFDSLAQDKIKTFFKRPFTPGKLFKLILDNKYTPSVSLDELLKLALRNSTQNIMADYGEGYWSDHWTYNMDLIDSYLSVYPENRTKLLFKDCDYKYFDSHVFVLPRSEKYVLNGNKVRQYNAILEDEVKKDLIEKRPCDKTWVRTENGDGEIYYATLFEKLLTLSLVKFTTLDSFGMGVEMEGNRPGWNDSLNGLPGMFGSGMSETFEIKRIVQFLSLVEVGKDDTISLPDEIYALLTQTEDLLDEYNNSNDSCKDYNYWDKVTTQREIYREKTRYGLSGERKDIPLAEVIIILNKFLKKLDQGIEKATVLGNGLVPTYFTFVAKEWEYIKNPDGSNKVNQHGRESVKVLKFETHPVTHFLEGPTKAMKLSQDLQSAKTIYKKVKKSELFDRKLKMYKTCAPLKNESMELGRGKAFTPGWLENESVFTHMEYKYILELLKAGLYDEFFSDMKNVLVPFMDPMIYGRSTLENSSFIASSANPDPATHGKGYVARLSGSTAEFLSMWSLMMAGKNPFRVEDGNLILSLDPNLPGWLFDNDGKISFRFLGKTDITYVNPAKKDTYGNGKSVIVNIRVEFSDNSAHEISGSIIPSPLAARIRSGEAASIIANLI